MKVKFREYKTNKVVEKEVSNARKEVRFVELPMNVMKIEFTGYDGCYYSIYANQVISINQ